MIKEATVRTIAMPADTNPRGDIFGGWIVSQMDLAAGIVATERAKNRVATVAISKLQFHKPVLVGDVVSCYATLTKVGNTSMTIEVEVIVTRRFTTEKEKVTSGTFVFVAIDKNKKPIPVDIVD